MKKITSILILLSTFLFCSSCSEDTMMSGGDGEESSPNIIFIIADDMGWDVFGDYPGADGVKANTPTLDSLAENGISFFNFWTNPICAPTRASMLTGKYAFKNGVGGVQIPQQATLESNETTLQKYIKENTNDKYSTAVIGKWHVSAASNLNAPEEFGIDFYSGLFLGAVPDYYNWTETSSGVQETNTTYATSRFVDQSVTWIEEQTKPFFLWLAFNAPHAPFHLPPASLISDQSLVDSQSAIDADPFPYYLAAIEAMDKEIARLIASMTSEQKENTVFVFMGDNGTPRQVSQSPYVSNRVKSALFQGGINCPLIVSGKGVARKNLDELALVHTPDMFATIADIAGVIEGNYEDGQSFKSLLSDQDGPKRNFIYSEQFDYSNNSNDGYTIRNENYKFIHLEDGTEYFYEIVNDPFEQNNLLSGNLSSDAQQNLDQLIEIKEGL